MEWNKLADDRTIEATAKALGSKNIEVFVVKDRNEAKAKFLDLVPKDAEVYCMSSKTLEETGIMKEVEEGVRYVSVRKKVTSINEKDKREAARKAASACQYATGSVHAVSEEGEVVIASQSGSQLAPYSFAASNVVWVVGAQKIVKNLDQAFSRIREYVVPLENERMMKAYGIGTGLNKMLIFEKEGTPNRIKMILVKEKLGF
jgi:L-lactate utilization protein LutC